MLSRGQLVFNVALLCVWPQHRDNMGTRLIPKEG
jgi:hypothetical protein